MRIQLLTVPDCPNLALARERIRVALAQTGAVATVEEHIVDTDTAAERLGMRGSPTILIDGVDPFADQAQATSLSCRLYRVDGGLAGAPSLEQLADALGGR